MAPHSSAPTADTRTLIATVAHELRQPLAVLTQALHVIRGQPGDASGDAAAAIAHRQLGQMQRLVEDLLDEALWATGRPAMQAERIDVREVIGTATTDAWPLMATHGQALTSSVPHEPLWALVDRQRLHQVLANLLANAIKFTPRGGHIALDAERVDDSAVLRVRDTGCGIDAAVLPRIFDLFFCSPSDAHGGHGHGLGLGAARAVVEAHGGRLELRSDGVGRGTDAVVTLPLDAVIPAARLTED